MYSRVSRCLLLLFAGWLASVVVSCAVTTPVPPSTPPPESTSPAEEVVTSPEEPSPRAVASLQLTEQGRMLLEADQPDDARSDRRLRGIFNVLIDNKDQLLSDQRRLQCYRECPHPACPVHALIATELGW